jgi:phosphoglycerate dehydrogenase-like enzyme
MNVRMPDLNVTVLGNPGDPTWGALERLHPDLHLTLSDDWSVLEKSLPDADAVGIGIFQSGLWPKAVKIAGKARWFHSLGTGVDRMLTPETIAHPATLTNGRGVFRGPLGDWTVAVMLHFAFDIPRVMRQQRESVWKPFTSPGIQGATMGVIGYGSIGREAAERAKPFGVKILALRRRAGLAVEDGIADKFYQPSEINHLIAQSDYILAATPLTKETKGMIGAAQIAAMKPNAVFINVGRGPVVEEAALIHALETGAIRGAALDVVVNEPLPAPHPFYSLPNVLLSPHTADHTEGFLLPSVDCFAENLERFRKGEPLKNVVDKHAGY